MEQLRGPDFLLLGTLLQKPKQKTLKLCHARPLELISKFRGTLWDTFFPTLVTKKLGSILSSIVSTPIYTTGIICHKIKALLVIAWCSVE